MGISPSDNIIKTQLLNHQNKLISVCEAKPDTGQNCLFYEVTDPDHPAASQERRKVLFPDQVRTTGLSLIAVPNAVAGADLTLPGQWQAISDDTYLYLFRALQVDTSSPKYAVYANRYVLVPVPSETSENATEFVLNPKIEARYQQSQLRETPGNVSDKPAFRNLDGRFFQEPNMLVPGVEPRAGRFCVALLPTDQAPTLRWMIFAAATGKDDADAEIPTIKAHSYLRNEYGWFDFGAEPSCKEFAVRHATRKTYLSLTSAPSCLLFRRQEKTEGSQGDALTGPRLMFASRFLEPTSASASEAEQRLACFDFALDESGVPIFPPGNPAMIALHDVRRALTALQFDGDADYVRIPADLPQTRERMTFECWLNNAGKSGVVCTRARSASDLEPGFQIYWNRRTDRISASFVLQELGGVDGSDQQTFHTIASGAPAPSFNQWHHVAVSVQFVSRDQESVTYRIEILFNAVPAVTEDHRIETGNKVDLAADGVTDFGRDTAGKLEDFTGSLDEIRLWGTARSQEQIQHQQYYQIEDPESEGDLIGYWKLNDAYEDSQRIALDSKGLNNGTVYGARWMTSTAPVSGPDGPAVAPGLSGVSTGLGVMTFLGDREITEPTLSDGADGKIHLYYSVGEKDTADRALHVLQYDTSVSRARYSVAFESAGRADTGTLTLSAHAAGPALNVGEGTIPVVSVAGSRDGTGAWCDVTFTTSKDVGIVESFTGVPTLLPDFSQVINGQASADPLDRRVRTGAAPFFDYSGTRPTIRLKTVSGKDLVLVTARNPVFPSALELASATIRADGAAVSLAITHCPIEQATEIDHRNGDCRFQIQRTFAPVFHWDNLPADARLIYDILDGVSPHPMTVTGARFASIEAGASPIIVVHQADATVTLNVDLNEQNGAYATVTATVDPDGAGGEPVSAVWEDVPTEPANFMAVMNLQADRTYTPEQAKVAESFVLIGANTTKPVRNHSQAMSEPEHLAAFFNVSGYGIGGNLQQQGDIALSPKQAKSSFDDTSKRPTTHSELFAAAPFVAPSSGRPVRIVTGPGTLAHAGNFGGFVPTPPTTSGDFSATAARSSWPPAAVEEIDLVGDFTFETWLRPADIGARQRLVTANIKGASRYTVGLRQLASHAMQLSPEQSAVANLARKDYDHASLAFWWFGKTPTEAEKPASIATLSQETMLLNKFCLGHVRTEAGDIWVGLQRGQAGQPETKIVGGQAPLQEDWYFVVLSIDMTSKAISLHWRKQDAQVFESGLFDAPLEFSRPSLQLLEIGRLTQIPGSDQKIGEIALWQSQLTSVDRDRLFHGSPYRDDPGLLYYWEMPDRSTTEIENSALYGPPIKLMLPENVPITAGPRPRNRIFAGAGRRFAEAGLALPVGHWNHIAITNTDNDAIAFDGTRAVNVKDSKSLSFGEQMAIDTRLVFEGLPDGATEAAILSKSDNLGNDASYQLLVDANGQVSAKIFLDDMNSYLFSFPGIALESGKACYLAASFKIVEVSDTKDIQFTYTLDDGTGVANPKNTFSTTLTGTLFLQVEDKIAGPFSRSIVLHRSTEPKSFSLRRSDASLTIGARSSEPSPFAPGHGRGFFRGVMGGLRLWSSDISAHLAALAGSAGVPAVLADGLEADWRMDEGFGLILQDGSGAHDAVLPHSSMWRKSRLTSRIRFYHDGKELGSQLISAQSIENGYGSDDQFTLGGVFTDKIDEQYTGLMDEVRLWNTARTGPEIADNLNSELAPGLEGQAGYWPIDIGSGPALKDRSGNGNHLQLYEPAKEDTFWWVPNGEEESPIGNETPEVRNGLRGPKTGAQILNARSSAASVEYGALYQDDRGRTRGAQYRAYSYLEPVPDVAGKTRIAFIPGFKVGDTDLVYIGQAQSDPTIVGYIEGAPPVAQENLTRPYYRRASTYQAYNGVTAVSFSESDGLSYLYQAGKDTGFDHESEFGLGLAGDTGTSIVAAPLGGGTEIKGPKFQGQIGAKATFSHSHGYLRSAERGIGTNLGRETEMSVGGNWQSLPENPSEERRYTPDNIGMALVKSATANVFALKLKTTGTLSGILMRPDPEIAPDFNIILFPMEPGYTKQGTLDGMLGFEPDPDYPEARTMRASYFKPREAGNFEQQIKAYEATLEADYLAFKAGEKGRRSDAIHFTEGDPVVDPGATIDADVDGTYDWAAQRSKRNLVNTYIWTADGGLYAESKQALASRRESVAGNYAFQGMAGVAGNMEVGIGPVGVYSDAQLLFGGHIDTSVEKDREESIEFGLEVSNACEDFLARWEADKAEPENDGESVPGKVTAYRFKTFYFSPSKNAFDDFFDKVVDQAWLRNSDDLSAQALRQARSKTNHVWRVLHRVTYVERVPPPLNQTPQDKADKPARTLIDVGQNRLLLDLIAQRIKEQNYQGSLAEKVGEAVREVMASSGQISHRIPWWQQFVADAEADLSGVSARALQRIRTTIIAYANAYFEDNPVT